MKRAHHIMKRAHHIMKRAHHIMKRAHCTMKNAHHIMKRVNCTMKRAHHIMKWRHFILTTWYRSPNWPHVAIVSPCCIMNSARCVIMCKALWQLWRSILQDLLLFYWQVFCPVGREFLIEFTKLSFCITTNVLRCEEIFKEWWELPKKLARKQKKLKQK